MRPPDLAQSKGIPLAPNGSRPMSRTSFQLDDVVVAVLLGTTIISFSSLVVVVGGTLLLAGTEILENPLHNPTNIIAVTVGSVAAHRSVLIVSKRLPDS